MPIDCKVNKTENVHPITVTLGHLLDIDLRNKNIQKYGKTNKRGLTWLMK